MILDQCATVVRVLRAFEDAAPDSYVLQNVSRLTVGKAFVFSEQTRGTREASIHSEMVGKGGRRLVV